MQVICIKYVFVKSRTFPDLASVATKLKSTKIGSLLKALGWNFDSVESSKKINAPEIIIQTARVNKYEELTDSSKIINDGVIPANASLAKTLLDDPTCPKDNKIFIGIPEKHQDPLRNTSFLARKINLALDPYSITARLNPKGFITNCRMWAAAT